MTGPNPADCLDGQTLGGEWRVVDRASHHPSGTGGFFSIGYIVEHLSTGRRAFLKAFDFSSAFQAPDFARELEHLTAAYNFERDLLNVCRNNGMRRVLTPIADGVHVLSGVSGPLNRAHYLVFDLAEGDIRRYSAELDVLTLPGVSVLCIIRRLVSTSFTPS